MRNTKKQGFTLFEILIVFSIIILIAVLILINLQSQVSKANDSRRKSDLNRIQKAFEEYYNDRQCYPYLEVLNECGGRQLDPYVKRMPCDPIRKEPYFYVNGGANLCAGYRICTKLENLKDPDIERQGCDPIAGCGYGEGYNYCVGVGIPEGIPEMAPGPSPTPTLTPTPAFFGPYACRRGQDSQGNPVGNCNNVGNPAELGCPRSFSEYDCQGLCEDDPTLWCAL
jgi:type II secretory pathway pseudopilin PulG